MTEKLKVTVDGADSFRTPLASEWGLGDVEAASIVRQGHSPSMAAAMLGVGVLKLLVPRPAKDLPGKFVLAVTPSRVIAFDASSHGRGRDDSSTDTFHVTVDPGEIGSWPRSDVSMRADDGGMTQNATLTVSGKEIPCAVPSSHAEAAFRDLIEKLGA